MAVSTKKINKFGKPQGLHPNSLANLKPNPLWQPGVSGHPQGESATACLQRIANKPLVKPDPKIVPAKELLAYETIAGGIKGKPIQFKEAWERLEGKVPDTRFIAENIRIEVVFEDRRQVLPEDAT